MQTVEGIVSKFILELNRDLKKKKIEVILSEEARKFIAQSEYSVEMGARPLKRFIQNHITNKLSDEILFGSLQKGGKVYVDYKETLLLDFQAS